MKQEPANAKCGHVYGKLAIAEWLEPMEKIPMTAEDHAKLENELQHQLQLERPRIIRQLAEARTDDSDLAKNAEYHATKQVQEQNETRIAELEDKLARADCVESPGSGRWVYRIVDERRCWFPARGLRRGEEKPLRGAALAKADNHRSAIRI
jgi:hypothetical protein